MPRGEGVAKALGAVIAARGPLSGIEEEGGSKADVQGLLTSYLSRLRVKGDAAATVKAFAYSLPKRLDAAAKTLRERMLAKGFDHETAASAARELEASLERIREEKGDGGGAVRGLPLLEKMRAEAREKGARGIAQLRRLFRPAAERNGPDEAEGKGPDEAEGHRPDEAEGHRPDEAEGKGPDAERTDEAEGPPDEAERPPDAERPDAERPDAATPTPPAERPPDAERPDAERPDAATPTPPAERPPDAATATTGTAPKPP